MTTSEFERQIEAQYSAMKAFPSQTPSLEQMFYGQNQRMSVEMQIQATKLAAAQGRKLEEMSKQVSALIE